MDVSTKRCWIDNLRQDIKVSDDVKLLHGGVRVECDGRVLVMTPFAYDFGRRKGLIIG